jgi:hypothetical protein
MKIVRIDGNYQWFYLSVFSCVPKIHLRLQIYMELAFILIENYNSIFSPLIPTTILYKKFIGFLFYQSCDTIPSSKNVRHAFLRGLSCMTLTTNIYIIIMFKWYFLHSPCKILSFHISYSNSMGIL